MAQMLKYLPIRQLSPRRLLWVSLGVLTLLSIGLLIYNRGVNFAYYNFTQVIQLPEGIDETVYARFTGNRYVSAIDRAQRQVHLQGMPTVEFNQMLTELSEGDDAVSISTFTREVLVPPNLGSKILALVMVTVMTLLGYTLFIFHPSGNVDVNVRKLRFVLNSFLGLGLAVLWQFGLLSLLSLVYELSELSFLSLIVMGIWGLVVLLVKLHMIDFSRPLAEQESLLTEWISLSWKVWLGLIVLMGIGLGVNFVVDALLMFTSVLFAGVGTRELPVMSAKLRQWRRLMRRPK